MPTLHEDTTKIQFATFKAMPALIYEACVATETQSNTVYIQRAVCEALARDLGRPVEELLAMLPDPKGRDRCLFGPDRQAIKRWR